jgi:hypothetical protein
MAGLSYGGRTASRYRADIGIAVSRGVGRRFADVRPRRVRRERVGQEANEEGLAATIRVS